MPITSPTDDHSVAVVVHGTGLGNPRNTNDNARQSQLQSEKIEHLVRLRGKMSLQDNWRALRQLDTPDGTGRE